MLRRAGRLWPVLLGLVLGACQPQPPPDTLQPTSLEASYRLSFNEALVGYALFVLTIAPDGGYRLEAFTVPAGQMAERAPHEVFETSTGTITADGVRPARFDHRVIDDRGALALGLVFDWARQRLRLIEADAEREIALLPDTHDRLSYLLAASRLTGATAPAAQIRIATPQATEDNRLERLDDQAIDVPAGRYQAIAVRRLGPDPDEQRTLWFDRATGPLPLRVERRWEGNRVEMALENLSRPAGHPR